MVKLVSNAPWIYQYSISPLKDVRLAQRAPKDQLTTSANDNDQHNITLFINIISSNKYILKISHALYLIFLHKPGLLLQNYKQQITTIEVINQTNLDLFLWIEQVYAIILSILMHSCVTQINMSDTINCNIYVWDSNDKTLLIFQIQIQIQTHECNQLKIVSVLIINMSKDINKDHHRYEQSSESIPRIEISPTIGPTHGDANAQQEMEQNSGEQFDEQDMQQHQEQHLGYLQDGYASVGTQQGMPDANRNRINQKQNRKSKTKSRRKRKREKIIREQYGCWDLLFCLLVVAFIFVNCLIFTYLKQKQGEYVRYGKQYINPTHLNQQRFSSQQQTSTTSKDIQKSKNNDTNMSVGIGIGIGIGIDAINTTIKQNMDQAQGQIYGQYNGSSSAVAVQQMISLHLLRQLPKHKNSIKQSRNKANRIKLGIARIVSPPIAVWKISRNTPWYLKSNTRAHPCAIVNGITSITTTTLSSIERLLHSTLGTIILYANVADRSIVDSWFNAFTSIYSNKQKYTISRKDNIVFTADYQFVSQYLQDGTSTCAYVVYMSAGFGISKWQMRRMETALAGIKQRQVLYTSAVLYSSQQSDSIQYEQQTLPNLSNTDLQHVSPATLANYVFIFDPIYLSVITPLNFAYYVRYSLVQLLVLPILATVQNTQYLVPMPQIMHTLSGHINGDAQGIRLGELEARQQHSYCFVSYTDDPYTLDSTRLRRYLESITRMRKSDSTQISIVVYVPYGYAPNQLPIWQAATDIFRLRSQEQFRYIRLRLRASNTLSSHAVYQSAYQYCPRQSKMISSRHNVQFMQDFLVQLTLNANAQKHYYHCNYMEQNNKINSLPRAPQYVQKQRFQIRKSNIFQQHYRHVQIYTNQFMRTTTFWVLKSGQLDFYETQAVFFILMMETIKLQVLYINKTLYKVSNRTYTQRQVQQIINIKKYAEYGSLPRLQLNPYKYNSLDNPAFRRYAPDVMQKNIHQVWLGQNQISQVRMHLHQSIKQVNPLFNVTLWRSNNITKYNFPFTYALTHRVLEYHKTAKTSFIAMAADLLRYEVVYQYGGIYVDFKMQAVRPADGFLKYQSFYLDAGNGDQRFGSPIAVGVGVIGANKNNYHLKIILNQLIDQSKIRFIFKGIPKQSGGFVVRKAYKDEELFMGMGLGYHLLFPKPYDNPVNQCGGFDKVFGANQKAYVIFDYFEQKNIKIGVPCKEYPQSYFINFTPLARTWRGDKRNVG